MAAGMEEKRPQAWLGWHLLSVSLRHAGELLSPFCVGGGIKDVAKPE